MYILAILDVHHSKIKQRDKNLMLDSNYLLLDFRNFFFEIASILSKNKIFYSLKTKVITIFRKNQSLINHLYKKLLKN